MTADSTLDINELMRKTEKQITAATAMAIPLKSRVYTKPLVSWYNEEVANVRREKCGHLEN